MPATTSSPIAFWDKGARYFFIQGPNNEKIEFCEILR